MAEQEEVRGFGLDNKMFRDDNKDSFNQTGYTYDHEYTATGVEQYSSRVEIQEVIASLIEAY